jgi:hypothetical protein
VTSYKKIWLRWQDSTGWDGWRTLPLEDTEIIVIETVGYLIEDREDRYVVAHSISSASHCDGVIAIPKVAVIKQKISKG